MTASGFWGFAIVLVLSIVILIASFLVRCKKTYIDEDGNSVTKTFYEFRREVNKTNKD